MCGNDMSRVMLDFSSLEMLNQGVTSTLEETVKRAHRISAVRDSQNVTGYDPQQPYPSPKFSLTWKLALLWVIIVFHQRKSLIFEASYKLQLHLSLHMSKDLEVNTGGMTFKTSNAWERKYQALTVTIPLPGWLFPVLPTSFLPKQLWLFCTVICFLHRIELK